MQIKISIFFISILFFSCSNDLSLQQYFVTSEDKENFLLIDIPPSLISLKQDIPLDVVNTFKTIKKVNVLALKLTKNNANQLEQENVKIKNILNQKKYIELTRVKDKSGRFVIKYLGNDQTIDEILIHAYSKDKGLLLGRILGKKMKPEDMSKLITQIQDFNNFDKSFKLLEDFSK